MKKKRLKKTVVKIQATEKNPKNPKIRKAAPEFDFEVSLDQKK